MALAHAPEFQFIAPLHGAAHGDGAGEWQDELMQLHGGGGGAEVLHAGGGHAVAEGFQQHGGFSLSQCHEVAGERIVVDGALQFLAHISKGGLRGDADVGHKLLRHGAFFLRHADVAAELQAVYMNGIGHLGFRAAAAALHEALQGAEVRHGQIRVGNGELGGIVVTGEHADADDAGAVGGVDIVLHIADEGGICRVEVMLAEQGVDVLLLVAHAGVNVLEIILQSQIAGLLVKGTRVHAGEDEAADAPAAAEIQKCPGVRNDGHLRDGVVKGVAVVFLQIGQLGTGGLPCIVIRVGQLEFIAKLLAGERGQVVLGKYVVGGFQRESQVIAKGAGPVEKKILEHAESAFGGDDVVLALKFEDGAFEFRVDEGVILAETSPGASGHAVELYETPVNGGCPALDAEVISHGG